MRFTEISRCCFVHEAQLCLLRVGQCSRDCGAISCRCLRRHRGSAEVGKGCAGRCRFGGEVIERRACRAGIETRLPARVQRIADRRGVILQPTALQARYEVDDLKRCDAARAARRPSTRAGREHDFHEVRMELRQFVNHHLGEL